MTFYNVVLPGFISGGSESAPVSSVDIVRSASGAEQRRSKRSFPLMRFNLAKNIRTVNDIYDVLSLFNVMNGPLHSFAIKDILDFKSCAPATDAAFTDAAIGTGDGVTAAFQLKKQYKVTLVDGVTVIAVDRTIYLPVQGKLLVGVAGTLKTETTHYTVNYSTGVITFTGGNIPTAGQAVTAGFEFNTKVRFDTNDLSRTIEHFRVGSAPSIPLIEVAD